MLNQVKVAVVQVEPAFMDKTAAVDKTIMLTKEAASLGAQIVLFPESFIPGYPQFFDFVSNGQPHPSEVRKLYRQYFENSMGTSDPEADRLSAVAAMTNTYLAVGITENDYSNIYCSVLFWGPDGQYLGKHRKLKPTGFERLVWSQGDGSILTAVSTPYGKMGSAICWENYMPLLRSAMYAKGVSLYLAPAADSSLHWQSTIQHIALEGRCFVLSCNHYVPANRAPAQEEDARPQYRGGSAIISPLGDYLAGPLYDQEGILVADLDLGQIYEARYDFDVVGHYARNDVFTLIVNERPQSGAEFVATEPTE